MASPQWSQFHSVFPSVFNIRNLSLTKPISDLTYKGSEPYNWLSAAIKAFAAIKSAFTLAPIVYHPNNGLTFVLGMEVSEP